MKKIPLTPSGFADAFASVEALDLRVAKVKVSSNRGAKIMKGLNFTNILDGPTLTLSAMLGHEKVGKLWGADLFIDPSLDTETVVLYSEPELRHTQKFICVLP